MSNGAAVFKSRPTFAALSPIEMSKKLLISKESDPEPEKEFHSKTRSISQILSKFFFPDLPEYYPLRKKITIAKSNTISGLVWDVIQIIASVAVCGMYVAKTYGLSYQSNRIINFLDLFMTVLLIVDLIIGWITYSGFAYWLDFIFWVDVSVILAQVVAMIYTSTTTRFDFFRCIRIFKLFRIFRTSQLMAQMNAVKRQMINLGLTLLIMVFLAAGTVQFAESNIQQYFHNCIYINSRTNWQPSCSPTSPFDTFSSCDCLNMNCMAVYGYYDKESEPSGIYCPAISFFDAIYFMVVTIATVGYGDITPTTMLSKVVVLAFIMSALITIPMRVSELQNLLSLNSPYQYPYVPQLNENHVVICGHVDDKKKLERFLKEFFHPDRSATVGEDFHAVFLVPHEPTEDIRSVIMGQGFDAKISYVLGSALSVQDLKKVHVDSASAIFFLCDTDVSDDNSHVEDAANILRALSVSNFNPHVFCLVQVLRPEDRDILRDSDIDIIVCLDEFKTAIQARNAICPGFSTFIENIFHSFGSISPEFERSMADWYKEYFRGAGMELYFIELDPYFLKRMRYNFKRIAEALFIHYEVISLGLSDSKKERLVFNPGVAELRDYRSCKDFFSEYGVLLLMADDQYTAESIEHDLSVRHIVNQLFQDIDEEEAKFSCRRENKDEKDEEEALTRPSMFGARPPLRRQKSLLGKGILGESSRTLLPENTINGISSFGQYFSNIFRSKKVENSPDNDVGVEVASRELNKSEEKLLDGEKNDIDEDNVGGDDDSETYSVDEESDSASDDDVSYIGFHKIDDIAENAGYYPEGETGAWLDDGNEGFSSISMGRSSLISNSGNNGSQRGRRMSNSSQDDRSFSSKNAPSNPSAIIRKSGGSDDITEMKTTSNSEKFHRLSNRSNNSKNSSNGSDEEDSEAEDAFDVNTNKITSVYDTNPSNVSNVVVPNKDYHFQYGKESQRIENANSLRNHIIVTGCDSNLFMFIMELRRPVLIEDNYHPIVIVHDELPSRWDSIVEKYNDIYFIKGSVVSKSIFERLNVEKAFSIALLSSRNEITRVDEESINSSTLFSFLKLERFIPKGVFFFVELSAPSNIAVLNATIMRRLRDNGIDNLYSTHAVDKVASDSVDESSMVAKDSSSNRSLPFVNQKIVPLAMSSSSSTTSSLQQSLSANSAATIAAPLPPGPPAATGNARMGRRQSAIYDGDGRFATKKIAAPTPLSEMNVVSTSSVTKSIDNGMGLNAHNNNSNNLANPALLLMKSAGGGASDVPVSSKPSIHKTLISNTLGIVSDNVLQADILKSIDQAQEIWDASDTHHVLPVFASARAFVPTSFESLMVQTFYQHLTPLICEKFLCGQNRQTLMQVAIPLRLIGRRFCDLFRLFMRNNVICLGLYRHPQAQLGAFLPYVFISPSKTVKIHKDDKAFVFGTNACVQRVLESNNYRGLD